MTSPRARYYKLHLEPNLENASFRGSVEIHMDLLVRERSITFDTVDLDISSCRIQIPEGDPFDVPWRIGKDTLIIDLGDSMEQLLRVFIEYEGKLNDNMVGFYRSSYREGKETKYMAVTQFEENDARRAFPCLDSPAQKAYFDVEFLVDTQYIALSNTPVIEIKDTEDGKRLYRFHRTPKMSTYLLFFGVGAFETYPPLGEKRKSTISRTNIPVRIQATAGKAAYGDYALGYAIRTLEYLDGYTGIPYPIGKLDLIAVPDFAYGAMENYGAVTFRENRLLSIPGVTSSRNAEDIALVTVHEIAHMWFGDLVSPKRWKYVWLNESFATMFQYKIIDEIHPEWLPRDKWILSTAEPSLSRDALIDSPPLELPGQDDVPISWANVDIVYGKGSRILLMLEEFLGAEEFKKGVKNYLQHFQFSSVDTADFLSVFQEKIAVPVGEILDGWIHKPGFPLVKVSRNGDILTFRQERFVLGGSTEGDLWSIPLVVTFIGTDGSRENEPFLLSGAVAEMPLPSGTENFLVNADRAGYYRVSYESGCENVPERVIAGGTAAPAERYGVLADLYALCKRGDRRIDDLIGIIERHFTAETDYLPLCGIAHILEEAYLLLDEARPRIKDCAESILLPALEGIGFEKSESEPTWTSSLRTALVSSLRLFGSRKVIERLSVLYGDRSAGAAIDEDLTPLVLTTAAERDPSVLNSFIEELEDGSTPEQTKVDILSAMGGFKDDKTALRVFTYAADSVSPRNRHYPFAGAGRNPAVYTALWGWFRKNVRKLCSFHPIILDRALAGFVPTAFVRVADEADEILAEAAEGPAAKTAATVQMLRESLSVNRAFRDRESKSV